MTPNTNYRNQGDRGRRPQDRNFTAEFKEEWITRGIDKTGIKFAEELGKYLKDNQLTTSQIRNVYGEMKRIQMKGFRNESTSFLLLKPKMAYSVARDGKKGLKQLSEIFSRAYECIEIESEGGVKQFNNLMDLMESILAYHKAYGGK